VGKAPWLKPDFQLRKITFGIDSNRNYTEHRQEDDAVKKPDHFQKALLHRDISVSRVEPNHSRDTEESEDEVPPDKLWKHTSPSGLTRAAPQFLAHFYLRF
jgi:hypothetical protein